MDLHYFEALAKESAAMIAGPQGLQMPMSVARNGDDTVTVTCLIKASAEDGRTFPYAFTLGAAVLSQSGRAVRGTLDAHFSRGAHAFFSRRSKTSW